MGMISRGKAGEGEKPSLCSIIWWGHSPAIPFLPELMAFLSISVHKKNISVPKIHAGPSFTLFYRTIRGKETRSGEPGFISESKLPYIIFLSIYPSG
jgi:hypothetical protein